MFVLLFRFIYANNIANLPPGLDYVQFLMPGIFAQTDETSQDATAMGQAFDAAKNDDSFYLPPEAFEDLPLALPKSEAFGRRNLRHLTERLLDEPGPVCGAVESPGIRRDFAETCSEI